MGVGYSVHSGYPLGRAALRSAFNCGLLSFTFLLSSIALAEKGPQWPSTSLVNNAVAGGVTFAVMGGARDGGREGLRDVRTALKVGGKWGLRGVVVGTTWWGLRKGWGVWQESARRRELEASVILPLPSSASAVAESPPSAVEVSAGWLPSWSPIRRSTEADLQRHHSDVERQQRDIDDAAHR